MRAGPGTHPRRRDRDGGPVPGVGHGPPTSSPPAHARARVGGQSNRRVPPSDRDGDGPVAAPRGGRERPPLFSRAHARARGVPRVGRGRPARRSSTRALVRSRAHARDPTKVPTPSKLSTGLDLVLPPACHSVRVPVLMARCARHERRGDTHRSGPHARVAQPSGGPLAERGGDPRRRGRPRSAGRQPATTCSRTQTRTGSRSGLTRRRTSPPRSVSGSSSSAPAG